MTLDSILKNLDPVVSETLDMALSDKDISVEQGAELFDANGTEMSMIVGVADELRRRTVGENVTYVVNRNINFTNVCIKRCGFCAFSRDFRQEEGYFLPTAEILRRAKEAWRLGATEICIQAGLPPKMDGNLYIEICRAIKKELPDIHIHAFSPEEVLYGALRSEVSVEEYLQMLKEAGVGSLPGTAAEILDQKMRDQISPGRISAKDWIRVIKLAHSLNIPTTSTVMYGHVESSLHKAKHLDILKEIQKDSHGFTEFVPLSFVHNEAPMYNNDGSKNSHNNGTMPNMRPGPSGNEVMKMHAVSRIMLNGYINNIQVSWVKEGARMSQLLLGAGANDLGGTLMNESISTAAGAQYGQLMKPKYLHSIIREVGRVPAQRTTLYTPMKVFDREPRESESSLDKADAAEFGSYHELIKLDKFRYRSQT
ncbi:MAG TPA: 5-amino-6-(D-ribitylamino)uracil--L-tyrosine 4-hydroxyphenyl transferase CofH [Candidatus Nitrosopolaris sp.]|nr:5-amino-6-(D-ribitylamino)uracil--L-tyrosine 4-hydroxyphenyl transferase CofH [Candidatus Nitrosopolaris sp.]